MRICWSTVKGENESHTQIVICNTQRMFKYQLYLIKDAEQLKCQYKNTSFLNKDLT